MSSVQYDVRKVFGRSVAVPWSSAIPYSGLDDVTIRGLALATLRHRRTPIRGDRGCLAINLFRSFCISAIAAGYGRKTAHRRATNCHSCNLTKVGARCGLGTRLNSPLSALVQPGHQRRQKLAQRRRPFGVLGATGGMAEIAVELEIARLDPRC